MQTEIKKILNASQNIHEKNIPGFSLTYPQFPELLSSKQIWQK